ncbi:polysaccharide biosynthesis/export family protein [Aliiroseovarius marinus]|uniref:polysaccharide biosynthesis/export family protein n=1 Tax=Aliiroseovarius marinus TaxID=2500159 RepID=UPI003D7F09BC
MTSFRSLLRTSVLTSSLAVTLAGCGVTYNSPTVQSQAAGMDVKVVPLTPQAVAVANRSNYTPLALPAAFYAAAGGSGLRGAGALPEMPDGPNQSRKAIETRLPKAQKPPRYRIGVGDVVLLATKGSASTIEGLSGLLAAQNQRQGYTVRDDGTISIPDIGQVELAGLTLEQAEDALFQALVSNNVDPAFSLEIAEFNSQHVAVGGAVKRGGLVPVTLNPLELGEALAQAGGISAKDADLTAIRIYRNGSLYQMPVSTFRNDPKMRHLPLLQGDAVFVDKSYDLDRAMGFYKAQIDAIGLKRSARREALAELDAEISLRRAALDERRDTFAARAELDAEERHYVYLAGEVKRQGRTALPYGRQATLADVLYENGGFDTTTGDPTQIYVLRSGQDLSEITAWKLDARNVINMTLATRLEMRPNDIVFIEEQPITKWSRALQQAFPILVNKAANPDSGS